MFLLFYSFSGSSNGINGTTNGKHAANAHNKGMEDDSLIVIGETGRSKKTQISQFLYHTWQSEHGITAVTQSRRDAVISISTRVAKEMKTQLGDAVGYTVRFEDHQQSTQMYDSELSNMQRRHEKLSIIRR